MSGSSATYPLPIQLGREPLANEGSKAVSVTVAWTSLTVNTVTSTWTYPINLLSQYQTGVFTSIQSVWVDNSTNNLSVRLVCQETLQSLLIPPFTQGMYPLLVGQAPQFSVTAVARWTGAGVVNTLIGSTTFVFLNKPQPYFETRIPLVGDSVAYFAKQVTNLASSSVALLGNPPGVNRYYVLTGFSLTLTAQTNFTISGFSLVSLYDTTAGSVNGILWLDEYELSSGTAGIFYQTKVQFSVPVLVSNPGGVSLNVGIIPSLWAYEIAIQYGTVLIQ